MANRSYTVLVVPERSSQVRRLTIPHKWVINGVLGVISFVALLTFLGIHYIYVVEAAGQNRALKNENVVLRARLQSMKDKLARIDGSLQRIDQFAERVRAITQLNDPERNLAIGPLQNMPEKTPEVLYAPGERIDFEDELIESKVAMRLLDSGVDDVEGKVLKQESGLRALSEFLADDSILLATTPSVRPTSSRMLTSSFGERLDPYTNHRVMHKGIDFAADLGADVLAPADGLVIFVGNRGAGYGKSVVVDHGFGVQTHFAHLSAFKVDVGQAIKRGQIIAAVGNTGRSTGAHLHYEVRFNGIPQDPEKFIIDR